MNKIDLIIDALEKYIAFTPSFYDLGKEALDAARELQAEKQEPAGYLKSGYYFLPTDPIPRSELIPRKEWVGLTELEVKHYNNRLSGSNVAQEIECKLRERNT